MFNDCGYGQSLAPFQGADFEGHFRYPGLRASRLPRAVLWHASSVHLHLISYPHMLNRAFFIWLPLSNTKMARGVWGICQMPHSRAAQALASESEIGQTMAVASESEIGRTLPVASESEIGWAAKNALRTRF